MQIYAWADARKQQLIYGGMAVLLLGVALAYFLYHRAEREKVAAAALSLAVSSAQMNTDQREDPVAYLKIATDYAGTQAAGQAMLRAATAYFAEGKYPEAQAQFERFLREQRENPLAGQALFGVAACLDAQGRTAEAAERYQNLIERRPNDSMISQARLKLGRIQESQGQPEKAKALYEEVTRTSSFGAAGAEAGLRLQQLLAKHPELAMTRMVPTNAPAIKLSQP